VLLGQGVDLVLCPLCSPFQLLLHSLGKHPRFGAVHSRLHHALRTAPLSAAWKLAVSPISIY
jgi:hypothetical protein